MPHIVVKVVFGNSEEDKKKIAEKITIAMADAIGSKEENVSVSIQEIEKENWSEVYKSDILPNWETLYKKPGYDPLN